jgi:hypothetical protein
MLIWNPVRFLPALTCFERFAEPVGYIRGVSIPGGFVALSRREGNGWQLR